MEQTQQTINTRPAKKKRLPLLILLGLGLLAAAAVIVLVGRGAGAWRGQNPTEAILVTVTGTPGEPVDGSPAVETPGEPVDGSPAVATPIDPAAAAAVLGVETMFTVDYEAGIDAWVEKICAISAEGGCSMANFMAESIAKSMQEYQADSTCTATPLGRVHDQGNQQYWVIAATVSGWAEDGTELVGVFVERQDETSDWKFAGVNIFADQQTLIQQLTATAVPTP
ncbi:MAG TPA: hypothetical protein PKG95_08095 [Anaerolineaceae bacterium]|nr:hypothetical protein [Anaerolineaceae bacterium]